MSIDIDREPKPRQYTGLRAGLVIVGILGSGAGCATPDGKTGLNESSSSKPKIVTPAPQPDLTQPQLVPAASAAEIPTLVPITISTKEPTTPTAVPPTKTSEPTAIIPATPTAKPSSTPIATIVEKSKSAEIPWLPGAVFYGIAVDKNGKKVAEMFRSRTSDEILFYWITVPDKDGARIHAWDHRKPSKIKGSHYEVGGNDNPPLSPWEEADYNEQKKTITGTMFMLDPKNGNTFELNYVGEGKEVMFATIARIMRNLSSDQPKDIPEVEGKAKGYIDRHFP